MANQNNNEEQNELNQNENENNVNNVNNANNENNVNNEGNVQNNQNVQEIHDNQNDQEIHNNQENPPNMEGGENQIDEVEQNPLENPPKEPKEISEDAYSEMFVNQLKTFNNLYKTKISKDKLASTLSDAWTMLTDGSEEKKAEGKKLLNGLFEAMLEHAYEVEKKTSYKEGRLPEYSEIASNANKLLRAGMFSFTDMYRDNSRAQLFSETAFGGMTKEEMSKLTGMDELWSLDQKSDEAWEIQAKEAKDIASVWQKKSNPCQTVVNEMNELQTKSLQGVATRKEVLDKLAAAEWLLLNDDNMVVIDPDDPYNRTPKWNNRYWKAITEAREAIGIPKHISVRDLIQGNYSVMQKTLQNANYHKDHFETELFSQEKRASVDSMDKQKEEFGLQSAQIALNKEPNEERLKDIKMDGIRTKISIVEEDEYLKAKTMPKDYSTFVVERNKEISFDRSVNN